MRKVILLITLVLASLNIWGQNKRLEFTLDEFPGMRFIQISEMHGDKYEYKSEVLVESTDANTQFGNLIIPASVIYEDIEYKVTQIQGFWGCLNIESITIPASVNSISNAFNGNTNLKRVILEDSQDFLNLYNVFQGCTGEIYVGRPADIDELFKTHMQRLVIGSNVDTIEIRPFTSECKSLKDVVINISDTPLTISTAFRGDGAKPLVELENFYIARTISNDYNFNFPTKSLTVTGNCASISPYSHFGYPEYINLGGQVTIFPDDIVGPNLKELIITAPIIEIPYNSFRCYPLSELKLPNTVQTIGEGAFTGCKNLKKIELPASLETIGNWAFRECGLTSLSLPSSVKSVGLGAFSKCDDLKSITIEDSSETIDFGDYHGKSGHYDNRPFYGAPAELYIGRPISFYFSEYATRYGLGDALVSVTFGDKCTEIPDFILCKSYKLTKVSIPKSTEKIGMGAFMDCHSLQEIELPNDLQIIPSRLFEGCESLSEITIPESINTISHAAFWGCSNLTKIYALPMSPANCLIGYDPNNFSGSLGNSESDVFNGVDKSLCTLIVSDYSFELYRNQKPWSEFFNIQTSGIYEIDCDSVDEDIIYYNLQGLQVESPTKGIYIIKQGNSVKKIYLP